MAGQEYKMSQLIKNATLVDALLNPTEEAVEKDLELVEKSKQRIDTMLSILDTAPVLDGTRPVAVYYFYPNCTYQAVRYVDQEKEMPLIIPAMLSACSYTFPATHPQYCESDGNCIKLTATPKIVDSQQEQWIFMHNHLPNLEPPQAVQEEQKHEQSSAK